VSTCLIVMLFGKSGVKILKWEVVINRVNPVHPAGFVINQVTGLSLVLKNPKKDVSSVAKPHIELRIVQTGRNLGHSEQEGRVTNLFQKATCVKYAPLVGIGFRSVRKNPAKRA
jgi:hypothetical protein